MSKLVKASAGLGGGGLIVGGGLIAKNYLVEDNSDGSSAPILIAIDDKDTLDKALKKMNLTLATTIDDFSKIQSDLATSGVGSWVSGIITQRDWNSKRPSPQEIQAKCVSVMSRKFSDYKRLEDKNGGKKAENDRRINELKTVKMLCTNNYSIIDNARDYVGDSNTIYYQNQGIDETKWKKQIDEFKKGNGNRDKSIDDMKKDCLSKGKTIYRKNSQDKNDFYRYCVIVN